MTVEFIFIVGIIIAIIGALSIAAVMWQSEAKSPATPSADEVPAPRAADIPTVQPPPAASIWPDEPAPATAGTAPRVEPSVTLDADEPAVTIESITASYAHANDDLVVAESALQINVANMLATQIERLYQEYVRLEEERTRLGEALLTNMLFEKIERSAGRLEITTERETLDLREKFSAGRRRLRSGAVSPRFTAASQSAPGRSACGAAIRRPRAGSQSAGKKAERVAMLLGCLSNVDRSVIITALIGA